MAQIQLVEIAKAINHRDVSILIMDEPTSALGEQETDVLFSSVRSLASLGKGIIYVSHRMTEIFTICDAYTVFRDGRFIEDGLTKEVQTLKPKGLKVTWGGNEPGSDDSGFEEGC